MSEAAEQLEAMAADAEMDKGNVFDLIKKMESRTSGHHEEEEDELSMYKSAVLPHHGSPLPLHPTSIKLESGCTSEP